MSRHYGTRAAGPEDIVVEGNRITDFFSHGTSTDETFGKENCRIRMRALHEFDLCGGLIGMGEGPASSTRCTASACRTAWNCTRRRASIPSA